MNQCPSLFVARNRYKQGVDIYISGSTNICRCIKGIDSIHWHGNLKLNVGDECQCLSMTWLCTTSFPEYLVMLHTVGKGTAASIISCSHLKGISDLSLTSNTYFIENTCRFKNKNKMPIQNKKCSSRDQEILGRHAFAGVHTLPRYFHGIKCLMPASFIKEYRTYHAPGKPRNGQYKKEAKFRSWNNNQPLWLFSKKFYYEAAPPPRRARRPRSCVGCRIRRLLPLRRGLELLRTYIEYNGWVLQVPESFAGLSWQVYM